MTTSSVLIFMLVMRSVELLMLLLIPFFSRIRISHQKIQTPVSLSSLNNCYAILRNVHAGERQTNLLLNQLKLQNSEILRLQTCKEAVRSPQIITFQFSNIVN